MKMILLYICGTWQDAKFSNKLHTFVNKCLKHPLGEIASQIHKHLCGERQMSNL